MKKRFNVTGLCFPDKHYMADTTQKLKHTMEMIEMGDYFIINRPRQYGKTTTLYAVADLLTQTGEFLVFNMSFEGLGDAVFEDEKLFSAGFVRLLSKHADVHAPFLVKWLNQKSREVQSLESLSSVITALVKKVERKIVIMIDEVDKSSNNQLFISFLAMLRNKYLERSIHHTFHSVVLAGLHDVKTLKLKLRPDSEQKYNSPWNIAADYTVNMNLQPSEIKPMLADYCQSTQVTMDTQSIAEALFYHTSGYPFLVSRLCKIIDEIILPEKEDKTWTLSDIEAAIRRIVKEKNTNFDSVIKNLENDPSFYDFIYHIIVEGDVFPYSPHEPLVEKGELHGIIRGNGSTKVHNRIYEQIIYNYMTLKTSIALKSRLDFAFHFDLNDGGLDMPSVLAKFQQFMKEEFNQKDKEFLEQHGRLVFLSFLAPILNGNGYAFKEVQTSEEKRLDIVATYNQHKYIIELKRWYGEAAHQRGIKQLSDYLEIQGYKTGFIVIFEYNKIKSWRKEWIDFEDKRLFAVWV